MKPTYFTCLFSTLIALPALLTAQTWLDAVRYSAAAGSTITNSAVAAAPGNVTYVTGSFQGAVTFGDTAVSTPGPGVSYGFLLKLDAAFTPEWVQAFPQNAYCVTTDTAGNVFIAGSKDYNSADSLTYVAKYNSAGQLLDTFQSSGTGKSWARVLRTDAAGNCYVTGWKSGAVTFGAFTPASGGSRDNFLVKLSPDLQQVQWAVNTGTSSNLDEVYDLELDSSGNAYTGGNYSQSFNLSCFCYKGSFFTEKHAAATGTSVWKKIYSGGSGTSTQEALSLSPDGQTVYTAASFKNTVQIATGTSLTAQSGTDDYHLFAAALNAADAGVQWAKKVSFTGDSYLTGMAWAENELHLHGYFKSNTLLGNVLLEPLGSYDAFYGRVTPLNGNVTAAEAFSGTGADFGEGIASGNGALAVSGNASGNTFSIGNFNLPGNAGSIYVARNLFNLPLAIALADTMNASCPGLADGVATVTAQGGQPPYTYLWSNNAATATAAGLSAGMYSVTVTDNAGAQAVTTLVITEPPAVEAGFGFNSNGLDVSFSNTSSNALSYAWTFGDGQSDTSPSPAHSYAGAGAYTVTLIATNDCGSDTVAQTVVVAPLGTAPVADFTADKMVVCVGDTVHFTSLTTNGNSFSWWFPGAEPMTSMLENPAVVYTVPGKQAVALTSSNPFGSDNETKPEFITVIGLPDAAYDFTSDGQTVIFNNLSQNADNYLWDFGDGITSTEAAPTHNYAVPGTYTVTLTAFNQCGSGTLQLVDAEEPAWLDGLRLFPNPNRGIFTVEMSSKPTDEVQFSLFGQDGRLLRQETVKQVEAGSTGFDCSDLPPALYLLGIRVGDRAVFEKVVIQR